MSYQDSFEKEHDWTRYSYSMILVYSAVTNYYLQYKFSLDNSNCCCKILNYGFSVNIPTKYIHIIQDQSRSAFTTHKKVKKQNKKEI
jgi:hypothetical protein